MLRLLRQARRYRPAVVLLTIALAVMSEGAASALAATTVREPPGTVLPCNVIGRGNREFLKRRTVVAQRVALPVRALQAPPPSERAGPNAWFFAKDGLVVRSGTTFELVVPEGWRGRFALSWGQAPLTHHLRVEPCGPKRPQSFIGNWQAFAGGYYVPEPACVPLIVRTPKKDYRVKVGVGVACPGQAPPATIPARTTVSAS